ncbi:heme biosynthesis HemY N-terminal domain-containing protein [Aquariibacter albus]|uniref:Heme biosynthesis protein HemY n=1 Tax=Aquariibacter albus TaxID=2759899 RepID=A0A839HVH9_9BURK|nr:heme biosynthesis HemY N-terminal domain-containing protein [Aquariibacter albus]MBB1162514.1 heme biosynthesis protein HemY [Aquariibacter albus]
MRGIVWLLVVAVVAVVTAAVMGRSSDLVSIYWAPWRIDLSLNLFLVLVGLVGLATVVLVNAVITLLGLPGRARAWRLSQRNRKAQNALREAMVLYWAGRYTRAHGAATHAVRLQRESPDLTEDPEFSALAELLAASSLHRLQDRGRRDEALARARAAAARQARGRTADEAACLLATEWAVDDRQADAALSRLGELPPGVARRTHALRLRLQAARLARQPLEALRTARLLAKHQAFSPVAAQGLLRSLAAEALDGARDLDQLDRIWRELDPADRRDPHVAAHAAHCLGGLGHDAIARVWLRPFWDRLDKTDADGREALALALAQVSEGLTPDWLPLLERAPLSHPREPALAYAVGRALAALQLWGKARQWLEPVADDEALAPSARREAWLLLAAMAEHDRDETRAAHALRQAAHVPLPTPIKSVL